MSALPLTIGFLLLWVLRISWFDIRHLRIRNLDNVALFAVGAAFQIWRGTSLRELGLSILAGFLIAMSILLASALKRERQGIGMGDIKFVIAAAPWVLWFGLAPMLLIASLIGLAQFSWRKVRSRANSAEDLYLPFGPALAAALLVVFVIQELGQAPWQL